MKSKVSELIFNVKKGTEKALEIGMFINIISVLYNKKDTIFLSALHFGHYFNLIMVSGLKPLTLGL